ncbi:50S ribosomal protein L25 [Paenibacillus albilobatus]|uniref:Large ribosomal subunit protein bL25 n=1 Tax=Paenibacillus albilobatus TaxID=2716884 RepID=A0A920CBW6_9BACL|nr:50S ribosomal protein L25 [Paenibacillus albilobatus]GIO34031.1 50S ribosomal protein L25 [Paenibacillus albilobatus]
MSHTLTAEPRKDTKHSSLRKLRESGRIPAVVYGSQTESIPLSVDAKELMKVARTGRTEMFKLKVEGTSDFNVIIKDFQKKSGAVSHVDFLQISANKRLKVRVPIEFQGTAEGTKVGGVLQHLETELEVEGLPTDLPATIPVDITHLQMGDKLAASDIKLPEGVTLVASPEELIASVTAPRAVLQDEGEAEAEGDAAPEASGEEAKE